jgi:hypothetical protein
MNDTTFRMREDPWRIFRIMAGFVDSFMTRLPQTSKTQ